MTSLEQSYQIVKKPIITEKATDGTAIRNAYTFQVPLTANKVEIRSAVEQLFNVKVKSVNTLRTKPKWRRRGRSIGQTPVWKKAIVTLAEDQTIELL